MYTDLVLIMFQHGRWAKIDWMVGVLVLDHVQSRTWGMLNARGIARDTALLLYISFCTSFTFVACMEGEYVGPGYAACGMPYRRLPAAHGAMAGGWREVRGGMMVGAID